MRGFVLLGKWRVVRDVLRVLAEVERSWPDLLGLCLDHAVKLK